MVKPDVVTLAIVPVEPPSAGPDRAFDPPPPPAPGIPWPAAAAEVDEDVGVDVADSDVAAHPVRPTAVAERTAMVIHAFFLFMISLLLFRKSP
jgi:hypothetical protein